MDTQVKGKKIVSAFTTARLSTGKMMKVMTSGAFMKVVWVLLTVPVLVARRVLCEDTQH